MKKIILVLFILLSLNSIAHASVPHYYEMALKYSYGDISVNAVDVKPVNYPVEEPDDDFIAEVLSYDNKTLYVTFFDFPLDIYYDAVDEKTGRITIGGSLRLNESETVLMLPYYENAKEIIVYDNKLNEKIKVDVSQYSRITLPGAEKDLKFAGSKRAVEDKLEALNENKNLILLIASILIFAIVIAYYVVHPWQKQIKP